MRSTRQVTKRRTRTAGRKLRKMLAFSAYGVRNIDVYRYFTNFLRFAGNAATPVAALCSFPSTGRARTRGTPEKDVPWAGVALHLVRGELEGVGKAWARQSRSAARTASFARTDSARCRRR